MYAGTTYYYLHLFLVFQDLHYRNDDDENYSKLDEKLSWQNSYVLIIMFLEE